MAGLVAALNSGPDRGARTGSPVTTVIRTTSHHGVVHDSCEMGVETPDPPIIRDALSRVSAFLTVSKGILKED